MDPWSVRRFAKIGPHGDAGDEAAKPTGGRRHVGEDTTPRTALTSGVSVVACTLCIVAFALMRTPQDFYEVPKTRRLVEKETAS